jgi:hypothetical protein
MGRRGALWQRVRAARWLLLAGGLAGLLAGCGSAAPLMTVSAQAGMSSCLPAPNLAARISHWNSPYGVSAGMYYNQSSVPVTVQAVSLVGAHNMVLHRAVVYEMVRYRDPLPNSFAWGNGPDGMRVNENLVQPVPGAVLAAGKGPVTNFPRQQPNVYEVAVDVSARQPGAAWAAGVNVSYTAGGQAHVIRLLIGIAISAQPHHAVTNADDPLCDTAMKAIQSAWRGHQAQAAAPASQGTGTKSMR